MKNFNRSRHVDILFTWTALIFGSPHIPLALFAVSLLSRTNLIKAKKKILLFPVLGPLMEEYQVTRNLSQTTTEMMSKSNNVIQMRMIEIQRALKKRKKMNETSSVHQVVVVIVNLVKDLELVFSPSCNCRVCNISALELDS